MSAYCGSDSGSARTVFSKTGNAGITGELVTDSDFLSCCRISQVAACSKQCKIPCELPGTKYALAALDPALSAENFT